jgi:L-seryl-tRNA(Ser) seleniumtransferase
LTVFSADKLLGGPQAGVVVGSEDAVERCKGHPLARALRASRLTLGALEGTLRLHMDPDLARLAVPVLRMLHESSAAVARRAAQLADALGGDVVQVEARLGGGAAPGHRLPSAACALPDVPVDRVARLLRLQHPALVARVADGRVLLDARTLQPDEVDLAISSVLNMRRETVG